jgi:hypothetical protein
VSDPESDHDFRQRVLRVASEDDRPVTLIAAGGILDIIGRKYDRFRTGVPLKGLEARGSRPVGSKR